MGVFPQPFHRLGHQINTNQHFYCALLSLTFQGQDKQQIYLYLVGFLKYSYPQKDLAIFVSTPSLDRPKSVKRAWPSESRTTLSGFKSLQNIN